MSARYSLSPTLRLQIADSRQRNLGVVALLCFHLLVVWLCVVRGYPVLAAISLGSVISVVPQLIRSRWVGAVLSWRGGTWWLEEGQSRCAVTVLAQSVAFPWAVLLVLGQRDSRRRDYLWLWNDSAEPQELRKLRVRLRLSQT